MQVTCYWNVNDKMEISNIGQFVHFDVEPNEYHEYGRTVVIGKKEDLMALKRVIDEAIECAVEAEEMEARDDEDVEMIRQMASNV